MAGKVLREGGVDGGHMGAGGEQGLGRRPWHGSGPAKHVQAHRDAGGLGRGLLAAHKLDSGGSDDPFGKKEAVGWPLAGAWDLLNQAGARLGDEGFLAGQPVGYLEAGSRGNGAPGEVQADREVVRPALVGAGPRQVGVVTSGTRTHFSAREWEI